jgi:hypothetical protein
MYSFTRLYRILTLTENGLCAKWVKQFSPTNKCDQQGKESTATALTMDALQGPFFLLAAGVCLGLFTLLVEIAFYKLQARTKIHPVRIINVKGAQVENLKNG